MGMVWARDVNTQLVGCPSPLPFLNNYLLQPRLGHAGIGGDVKGAATTTTAGSTRRGGPAGRPRGRGRGRGGDLLLGNRLLRHLEVGQVGQALGGAGAEATHHGGWCRGKGKKGCHIMATGKNVPRAHVRSKRLKKHVLLVSPPPPFLPLSTYPNMGQIDVRLDRPPLLLRALSS